MLKEERDYEKNPLLEHHISKCGTDRLPQDYVMTDSVGEADGVLVRSAYMHDMELPESCWPWPEPEPVSTTFHWTPAPRKESWCSTPPGPMPTA